jgi:hypothetical protein
MALQTMETLEERFKKALQFKKTIQPKIDELNALLAEVDSDEFNVKIFTKFIGEGTPKTYWQITPYVSVTGVA